MRPCSTVFFVLFPRYEIIRDILSYLEFNMCRWLERTPGLEETGFNFWEKYRNVVATMLQEEEDLAMVRADSNRL